MANNYNVDDILAEVSRKKGTASGEKDSFSRQADYRGNMQRVQKEDAQAQFSLKGMTGEFAAPPVKKRGMAEETRTDLPTAAKTAETWKSDGKTQVIPAVKESDEESFQRRRQQKVQQFMKDKSSFEKAEELVPEDEGTIEDLNTYFKGLKSRREDKDYFAFALEEKHHSGSSSGKKKRFGKKKHAPSNPAAKKEQSGLAPVSTKTKEQTSPKLRAKREEEEENEYNSPADARDVKRDILDIKKSLSIRLIVTGVLAVILLYLSLCNLYPLPLINKICPEVNMQVYLLVNLLLLVISALVANAVIGSGLISLFTLKSDHDTPAALCVLAAIIHGIVLVINSDEISTGQSGFYFFVAGLVLFANTIGKRIMIARIENNFAVASAEGDKRAEFIVSDGELAAELARGQGFSEPNISYSAKIGFPEKFLKLSYGDDYSENLSRYISPIFLLFAVALALTCKFAFDKTVVEAMTVFAAVLCIASPLTPTIIGNLPLWRASKALNPEKAFISGHKAVDTFDDVNCITLSAKELYPPQNVEVHAIKALAQSRIDEAMLDVASISDKSDGLITEAFLEMIGNRRDMLLPVEEMYYEDNGGISANVGGKPVLLGKRAMMERHNILLPPEDYEKKLTRGGKKALYVANSGQVTAIIIVSYRPDPRSQRQMAVFAKKELSIIVSTGDPSITAKKISKDYRYPKEFIRIVPGELVDSLSAVSAYRDKGEANIVYSPAPHTRLHALAVISALHSAIMTGTILQMAGLILGYALVAFMAFTGAINSIGFGQLAVYQLIWAVIILILPNLKKM